MIVQYRNLWTLILKTITLEMQRLHFKTMCYHISVLPHFCVQLPLHYFNQLKNKGLKERCVQLVIFILALKKSIDIQCAPHLRSQKVAWLFQNCFPRCWEFDNGQPHFKKWETRPYLIHKPQLHWLLDKGTFCYFCSCSW